MREAQGERSRGVSGYLPSSWTGSCPGAAASGASVGSGEVRSRLLAERGVAHGLFESPERRQVLGGAAGDEARAVAEAADLDGKRPDKLAGRVSVCRITDGRPADSARFI